MINIIITTLDAVDAVAVVTTFKLVDGKIEIEVEVDHAVYSLQKFSPNDPESYWDFGVHCNIK